MKILGIVATACALTLATVHTARADWTVEGDTLYTQYASPVRSMEMARDGAGGVLVNVNWNHSTYAPIRGYRVFANGTHNLGWDPGYGEASDGWGYSRFFDDTGLYRAGGAPGIAWAGFVPTAGGPGSGWGKYVVQRDQKPMYTGASSDGNGGMYVAVHMVPNNFWTPPPDSMMLFRVQSDGAWAPGWTSAGVVVTRNILFGDPVPIVTSVQEDAIVAWGQWTASTNAIRAKRFTAAGAADPAWPIAGAIIGDGTGNIRLLGFRSSGPDHVLCCWASDNQTRELRVQRVSNADGSVAPGWPAGGISIVQGVPTSSTPALLEDGSDGLILVWNDNTSVRGSRIQLNGTLATGWPAGGLSLLDASAILASPSGTAFAAARTDDGLLVSWSDTRRPGTVRGIVRARSLLMNGTADPTWPDSGLVVSNGDRAAARGIVSDGAGGAFVGWEDFRFTSLPYNYHMVTRVYAPVPPVSVGEPGFDGTTFGRIWPNPARDATTMQFSLASGSSARLELIDIAGRRVRSREILGAGSHTETFAGLDAVKPGVYFVRLTHEGRTQSSRVAIVH